MAGNPPVPGWQLGPDGNWYPPPREAAGPTAESLPASAPDSTTPAAPPASGLRGTLGRTASSVSATTPPVAPSITPRPPGPATPREPVPRAAPPRPATPIATTAPPPISAPHPVPPFDPPPPSAPEPAPTPDTTPIGSILAGAGESLLDFAQGGSRRDRSRSITVGRSRDCDLVIDDVSIADRHAEIVRDDEGVWTVHDLGMTESIGPGLPVGVPAGVQVNGLATVQCALPPGTSIRFGNIAYTFDDGRLAAVGGEEPLALDTTELTFAIPTGEVILDGVELSLQPRQLLAVVGPTGSGKSTLLKTLTGFLPPSEGEIFVAGTSLYERFDDVRRGIGYVPQDDILHPQLTIRKALEFGAVLRFGADATEQERTHRVDEVMAELGLTQRADTAIEKLSGGQRKRTSVALELLTRPKLLMLDEPTSGLDPGFEKAVMELLRELADAGRTVIVVTHSLQSLDLCDKVLFLAPGGKTAYFGPPAGALTYFGKTDYADVFQDLETKRDEDWKGRFAAFALAHGMVGPGGTKRAGTAPSYRAPRPSLGWKEQVNVLAKRQVAILAADRKNLGYLAAEVLVPAVLILALVNAKALNTSGGKDARMLIGALAISASVIGAANAIREIVKETPIYLRERSIGLSRTAYLTSKVSVIGALSATQACLLVFIAVLRADGPGRSILPFPPLFELMGDVALAAVVAVALGLLCSALVSSSEKAMALVPVIFIVMWLFSGIALDLQSKPVMREIGYVTSANWGVAAAAATVDEWKLEGLCGSSARSAASTSFGGGASGAGTASVTPSCDGRWQADAGHWLTAVGMEVLLFFLALAGASEALARKEPVSGTDQVPTLLGRLFAFIGRIAHGITKAATSATAGTPSPPPPPGPNPRT